MRHPVTVLNFVGSATIVVAYLSTVSALKATGGFAQAPYQNFRGVYTPATLHGTQAQSVQSGIYTPSTTHGSQIYQSGTYNPVNTQLNSVQSTQLPGTYNPNNPFNPHNPNYQGQQTQQGNQVQPAHVTGTYSPNNPFNPQNPNYQGHQTQQRNQEQPAHVTGTYNPNNPFNPQNSNYQGEQAKISGTYDPYKNANKPFEPACGNVKYSGNEGATGTGLSNSMMNNMLEGQNVHINQQISGDGKITKAIQGMSNKQMEQLLQGGVNLNFNTQVDANGDRRNNLNAVKPSSGDVLDTRIGANGNVQVIHKKK